MSVPLTLSPELTYIMGGSKNYTKSHPLSITINTLKFKPVYQSNSIFWIFVDTRGCDLDS